VNQGGLSSKTVQVAQVPTISTRLRQQHKTTAEVIGPKQVVLQHPGMALTLSTSSYVVMIASKPYERERFEGEPGNSNARMTSRDRPSPT